MSPSNLPAKPKQPPLPVMLEQAGQAADQAAARHRFADYRSRRAAHTVRRQDADLALFAEFLYTSRVSYVGELNRDPEAWRGVTWGLVEAFVKWMLKEGYAVASVNVRLSTVKTYARLAFQAGAVSAEAYALIRAVQGYSQREKRRLDQQRPHQRVGLKKAAPVSISPEQARLLKTAHEETPQGRRDALMMCLLLDHGLRVGELAGLPASSLDADAGLLRFFRPKVNKTQTHRLSRDALAAAHAYLPFLAGQPEVNTAPVPVQAPAPLLRASLKNGQLGKAGMTERAITQRVNLLGRRIGLTGLSAHDCRHYWATAAARSGTDPFSLQQAGGWSSLAMPRRYVEDDAIANKGLRLDSVKDD
jgi:integrase